MTKKKNLKFLYVFIGVAIGVVVTLTFGLFSKSLIEKKNLEMIQKEMINLKKKAEYCERVIIGKDVATFTMDEFQRIYIDECFLGAACGNNQMNEELFIDTKKINEFSLNNNIENVDVEPSHLSNDVAVITAIYKNKVGQISAKNNYLWVKTGVVWRYTGISFNTYVDTELLMALALSNRNEMCQEEESDISIGASISKYYSQIINSR
ncbi:MAG TPA: hypothetical protein PKH33_11210 [bacterium]|nr:hypothetical protein [bacterium]